MIIKEMFVKGNNKDCRIFQVEYRNDDIFPSKIVYYNRLKIDGLIYKTTFCKHDISFKLIVIK